MITVRPIAASDRAAWSALYSAYADFYHVTQTEEMRDTVWTWLHDLTHGTEGLLAIDDDGAAVGLAHFRPYARPLSASVGGFLDDLFVAPSARGREVSKVLIAELVRIAGERGWTVVRWITAEDNYRARATYDKIATRTQWVTYDIPKPAAR